jgi:hypothetical protein
LKDSWQGKQYVKAKLGGIVFLEGLLVLYFLFALASGIAMGDYGLIPFHMLLIVGFSSIFYFSVKHARFSPA